MGTVYRAAAATGELVAIKVPRTQSESHVEALRREITILSGLQHERVVRLLDHDRHAERPWYAMELLAGPTLRGVAGEIWSAYRGARAHKRITSRVSTDAVQTISEPVRDVSSCAPLAPVAAGHTSKIYGIASALFEALDYLCEQKVVHCDLKPENIVLSTRGPVLIDFGLSAFGTASQPRLTRCTVEYTSPEQIKGEPLAWESDLYAMGCILYELFTGVCPFRGQSSSVVNMHLTSAPLPPSQLVHGLTSDLEQALLGLLSKQPLLRRNAVTHFR